MAAILFRGDESNCFNQYLRNGGIFIVDDLRWTVSLLTMLCLCILYYQILKFECASQNIISMTSRVLTRGEMWSCAPNHTHNMSSFLLSHDLHFSQPSKISDFKPFPVCVESRHFGYFVRKRNNCYHRIAMNAPYDCRLSWYSMFDEFCFGYRSMTSLSFEIILPIYHML